MTAALEGSEWSAARPGRTLPQEKTRYSFYRGGPKGRYGREENLVPTGIRSADRPARSQSLYRLSYRTHISSLILSCISIHAPSKSSHIQSFQPHFFFVLHIELSLQISYVIIWNNSVSLATVSSWLSLTEVPTTRIVSPTRVSHATSVLRANSLSTVMFRHFMCTKGWPGKAF